MMAHFSLIHVIISEHGQQLGMSTKNRLKQGELGTGVPHIFDYEEISKLYKAIEKDMTLDINAGIHVVSDFDKMLRYTVDMYCASDFHEGEFKRLKQKRCSVLNRFTRVANEMEHVEKILGYDKCNEVDVSSPSSDDIDSADDNEVVE